MMTPCTKEQEAEIDLTRDFVINKVSAKVCTDRYIKVY